MAWSCEHDNEPSSSVIRRGIDYLPCGYPNLPGASLRVADEGAPALSLLGQGCSERSRGQWGGMHQCLKEIPWC
jgi:hypothetical protein